MTDLGTALVGAFDALQSHALASGRFDRVNGHEPKAAPGNGLTAALWADAIRPAPARSGLASTTFRFSLFMRCYLPMIVQPQDAIDPTIVAATGAVLTAVTGDFTLGGTVSSVDLMGAHGDPLQALAGYLDIDGKKFRAMTITVPCILDDALDQAP